MAIQQIKDYTVIAAPAATDKIIVQTAAGVTGYEAMSSIVPVPKTNLLYTSNAAPTLVNNTATKITYEDLDHDALTEYATGVFTADYDGIYHIEASIQTASVAWDDEVLDVVSFSIYKNKSFSNFSPDYEVSQNAIIDGTTHAVTSLKKVNVILKAGDTIEAWCLIRRGSSNTALSNDPVYNYISIDRLNVK
jgi:hypothetical protein